MRICCLSLSNVRDAAVIYLRLQEQSHQVSEMLKKLILDSVTARVADRLFHQKDSYTVNLAIPPEPDAFKEDGPCLLYELITMT